MKWCTPLIPAFGRPRQWDICKFKASLALQGELLDNQSYTEKPCLKKQQQVNNSTCKHYCGHLESHFSVQNFSFLPLYVP